MNIKLQMQPAAQVIRNKGLSKDGDVQRFHTANVLRRIIKYMPYLTGITIKVTVAQTNINKPRIITDEPFARFLYHGVVMVGVNSGSPYARKGEPKKVTNRLLQYTKTKNPLAGPYWDRALIAAEGAALTADLQRYMDNRRNT